MPTSRSREYDLVLFGATGFTGRLTADYLARHAPASCRWALAGRDRARLAAVREQLVTLEPACAELPLLTADVNDPAALQRLARCARVVITTVGPYIRYGEPLVAACAVAGTDYVDLTGEPEFVDRVWLRHHRDAEANGARIVHCCGFDSIPHDLGAYFTVQQLPADEPLQVDGFVRAGGRFSGGTYHSAITALSRLGSYRRVAAERRAREAVPQGRRVRGRKGRIHYRRELHAWAVPFPTIDPQVVLRSARALDRYGPDFRYGHYLLLKRIGAVAGLLGAVSAALALAQFTPTRDWLLAKKAPGDGPSESERAEGWFKVRFLGRAAGGRSVVCEVGGGDPGYGETSRMLAESALCLAFDPLPQRCGQLTPAVAMGDALLARLRAAGISFEIIAAP
ncbi:MAG: saccharopine dehydrogenase NADP-binding domain-containing protein [Gammaproteobacteria bacterium]|nr:saccharopine dehydrogenase NADP-binding domain-containing protein [Gammaproteobacteria bacterium]